MGTVQRLREVQRRRGIERVGRNDESQVVPVVEVSGAIGTDAPCPDIRAQGGKLLVLTVPIIHAVRVLVEHLEAVSLNGIAIGVEPHLTRADAVITVIVTGLLTAGGQGKKNGCDE